ncbi:periplasmic heavy metal sensor [Dongia sedimenti]|uniref:Periplasmic heavy metal sensor n=1 Tax=Dongia sedimenti TaxID=3064282 RepID=A0ABU0YMR9_9PROT|nr:periplasmic heavy metal sensor [Rhodospirillaceae bacterium R-7]
MTISGAGAKWLIGVAAVSLCINLFLVGLMAGHWIYGPGFLGRGGPDGPRRGIEAMIAGVPEDLRPMIKQKFDAAKPQFQAQREQIRTVRDKLAAAAEADPFDPAAFDQAFGEFQQAMDGMGAIAHQTIREILPQIPAAQRKQLVEKWSKRWGKGPDGPPPPPPGEEP